MTLSGLIAVLVLAGAAIFGLFNQPLVYEPRAIQLPGGTYTVPLIGILMGVAAAAVLLMLLSEAATLGVWRWRHNRLAERLAAREREGVEVKSRKYDEVSVQIEAMRAEVTNQLVALRRLLETRPTQTVVRDTVREAPDGGSLERETSVAQPR